MMTDLSILDLSPFRQGETFAQAVDNTVALAQHAEKLGLSRFWIAEHHNMPYLASSATSLLIQRVLDKTAHIRVGSGGVMLPNHSPFVVAEYYGTLASLYSNRVDLGLGRAPGTDPETARAIRRNHDDFAMSFPNDIKELQFYFGDGVECNKGRAYPAKGLKGPLYILGSSTESAYLAAQMGLPYAFASHFAPHFLTQAVQIYRNHFQPSAVLDTPKVIVGVNAFVADIVTGQRSGMKPPATDIAAHIPAHIVQMADSMMSCRLLGSPKTVAEQLDQLQSQVQADELMAVSYIYDVQKQHDSYELLSDIVKNFK